MNRLNRTHLSGIWKSVLPILSLVFLLPSLAFATLSVEVELGPKPVRQSETLMAVLTVTNSGPGAESDLFLQAVMPASGIGSTGEGVITGGGHPCGRRDRQLRAAPVCWQHRCRRYGADSGG